MRRRPKVTLRLSPSVVAPGETFHVAAVLAATSETPVEFVALHLRAITRVGTGTGNQRRVHEDVFFEREWRSEPMLLQPGEHRVETELDLLTGLPPSYVGPDTSVAYTITVHVSIPWWPDRKKTFVVPVAFAPLPRRDPEPKVFVTSRAGPTGKTPFMELSLDATQVSIGDEIGGSICIQNLHGRRIRGIDLSFVEVETVTVPSSDVRKARRFTLRVLDGAPVEGTAIPFRVVVPESATPTFAAGPLSISTEVEARADVAWGQDLLVRGRLFVSPRATSPRPAKGWVAPVGHERQRLVWQNVAARTGLTADAEDQRMQGQVGSVSVEIVAERRDADYWLVAKLRWPSLGLDLDIAERGVLDALAVDVVRCGDDAVDRRLRVRAREHAQAKAVLTPSVLGPLLELDEVKLDDRGAVLSSRGAAHLTAKVEAFVRSVLGAATALDGARRVVPPPALFGADAPAWETLATRLRGRLELGRMWIHGAQVGPCAVDIGSLWSRSGLLVGSIVRVAIEPPLGTPPSDLADPALAPAAREALRELTARARSVQVAADAIVVELEGKLADPQDAMPVVELATSLRRALGGSLASGPFR